ncbi:MAG TPA: biotin-dependent carboxyltransferase family protein [Chitinophagaceae bacterium]|jgi:antagonist of KipI|nr:biotin-dependent carboxyltransferase family protein [Chitinophagaceae bacterium]
MNVRIIKAGVLDSIQDLGRYGHQHLGINPGGVMDKLSAQLANILVGNDPKEAVIEMHFPAAAFFFEKPALIAISGADFTATVNGEEVPCLQPVLISKFSILQFHGIRNGARAYLAVHGGFDIQQWLNSYSTQLKAGIGGFKGRALQKDDEIELKSATDLSYIIGKKEFEILPWKADDQWDGIGPREIMALPGNEWDRLDAASKERFRRQFFTVTMQSDRMGYHLKGTPLSMTNREEVVSSAVTFGTVQLLPDGQLIVLMADHQTAGGYPRIAHVITAHHGYLAQLKLGELLQFQLTDLATAEELLARQQRHLRQLQNACKFRLEEFFGRVSAK